MLTCVDGSVLIHRPKPALKDNKSDVFLRLPLEIKLTITSFLSPRDIVNASTVCSQWQRMFHSCGNVFDENATEFEKHLPKEVENDYDKKDNQYLWQRLAVRFDKIEDNWRTLNSRFLDIKVDDMTVIWFRMHDDLTAIFTNENSLHIASISKNRLVAELSEFHNFSSDLQPYIQFDHTGQRLLFALEDFIKVCGIDNDWCQCMTIEILTAEDFVHCQPAIHNDL
ncbi:unnamed protein product [Bursaphelenchus okinawaensis]|uniref:F-box domain-containing protein n=1 Tax=Bursaphelenchus okinawaensis TaxID=465554 RepID=A0A811LG63_9BILA|nr:unnamed protein product [Bursaphelenchus okinawaensis]CAG9122257.1 unnamed protein product [Bursaphelenchus okinawaensis]